jgi:hypothetical protein
MNNQNVIVHKLASGDTLYELAKRYKTTADGILAANPYLDPYKLKIGDEIIIYPGRSGLDGKSMTNKEVDLMNKMRNLWEQHSIWTRSLIISIADDLKDLDFVTKRLLRNPKDIGNLFRIYYGDVVAKKIEDLFTDHLVIGSKLVTALKAGDTANAAAYNQAWYKNADDIAAYLASINPYFVESDIKQMLYKHLDLVKKEASDRLAGNYEADIKDFDDIEKQALEMADTFSKGIINQFSTYFL